MADDARGSGHHETDGTHRVLARARELADDVLFPGGLIVDRSDVVPATRLDLLAEAGLYGTVGPVEYGGLDCPAPVLASLVEVLASGCLTTTLVWVQHHRIVRTLAASDDDALHRRWLPGLCSGQVRAGVVFTGLIPGEPRLRARRTRGWRLDGAADWVSGWGRVDVLLVLARGPGDTLLSLIVDAAPQSGLHVKRRSLVAVNASVTVTLRFDGVRVAPDRLVSSVPFVPSAHTDWRVLRTNGSLALGVAGRACRLLGPSALDDALAARRAQLDEATEDGMADARAAASAFAVRATSALMVHEGSRSVAADQHAQRLAREALVLLVFGSRPAIKTALADRLIG